MTSPSLSPHLSLIVDANVVLGMVTHPQGRQLLADPVLRLAIAAYVFNEFTEHLERILLKKVTGGRMTRAEADTQHAELSAFAMLNIERVPVPVYTAYEDEARDRVLGYPDDWHTVALALAVDAEIWTNDTHFLGCGVPVWTNETLRRRLAAGRLA